MFYLIELGNICNLKCISCCSRLEVRPKGFMKPDVFRNIVDQYLAYDKRIRYDRIVLHGYSELLLNPYLWANLDYLQEKGFTNVDFSDNCMLLTEEIVKKLCSYTIFSWIKLSLNSSRKELMEYINTGSNFDKVVDNIRMFCDVVSKYANFKVLVQLMHTAKNMDETPQEVKNLIQRSNIQVHECNIMRMIGIPKDNDLLIPNHIFWGGTCTFSQVNRMIHWDGDLVGCCIDNTKSQVYGNYKDGIYSNEVESRRSQWQMEMEGGKYVNLPVCKVCDARINSVN